MTLDNIRLTYMAIFIFVFIVLLYIAYRPVLITQTGGRPTNLIQGIKYSSNTGLDTLDYEYSSKYAALDSKRAWGGNVRRKYFTYLEIELPQFSYVTGIVTAGYDDMREWVTEYYIEYWDNYRELWVKYDKVFVANVDDHSRVINNLEVRTSKIRVYPIAWETNPSMRVGIIGRPATFSKCRYYQTKMRMGDRERYHKLYTTECSKVSINKYRESENRNNDLKKKSYELELELLDSQEKYHQLEKQLKTEYCPREQLHELALKFKEMLGSVNTGQRVHCRTKSK